MEYGIKLKRKLNEEDYEKLERNLFGYWIENNEIWFDTEEEYILGKRILKDIFAI